MRLLPRRPSPLGAAGDLRSFFAARKPIDLILLFPALAVTVGILYMLFAEYSGEKAPYKRNIIYVQSWPLNRSDADIRAAQIADQRTKKLQIVGAKIEKNQRMLQFRRVNAWLSKL